ncbi:MAG TPA: hypothetical protein VE153_32175 [Myxococcus sp.]|nr:hypothetical protein [Myxococcus sp.]
MLIYTLKDHWPGITQLFGATAGQDHIAPLLEKLQASPPGETVIYDFSGVEHATASYLRATVLRLLRASLRSNVETDSQSTSPRPAGESLDIFLLVANLSEDVAEEFQTVLESQGLACLEATRWDDKRPIQARVRGVLEGVLRDTLVRVVTARNATATMLAEREPPNVTGWNNRLAELYRMRLVTRVKEGRQWIYSAVCSEVVLG